MCVALARSSPCSSVPITAGGLPSPSAEARAVDTLCGGPLQRFGAAATVRRRDRTAPRKTPRLSSRILTRRCLITVTQSDGTWSADRTGTNAKAASGFNIAAEGPGARLQPQDRSRRAMRSRVRSNTSAVTGLSGLPAVAVLGLLVRGKASDNGWQSNKVLRFDQNMGGRP